MWSTAKYIYYGTIDMSVEVAQMSENGGMRISTAYLDEAGLVVEVPDFGEECVVYPEWISVNGKVYEVDEDEELLREVLEHPGRFVLREWRDNQYSYHYYLFKKCVEQC